MLMLPIEAALFHLRESIASRGVLEDARPRMLRTERIAMDYSVAMA